MSDDSVLLDAKQKAKERPHSLASKSSFLDGMRGTLVLAHRWMMSGTWQVAARYSL